MLYVLDIQQNGLNLVIVFIEKDEFDLKNESEILKINNKLIFQLGLSMKFF